jgi:ADP-ribosyl-[dinitrogen reductase] hydrolase
MNLTSPQGLIIGIAIGDALGVPVEFISRNFLKRNPVTCMQGFGTHNQPPGTWSDDTSLSYCLAETLLEGYDLNLLAQKFEQWYSYQYWTPNGHIFDTGISTRAALEKLSKGTKPEHSGESGEYSNGNGSLMRILPIVFYLQNKPIDVRFEVVRQVSGITHAHIRSVMACFFAIEFLLNLLEIPDKFKAYRRTQNDVRDYVMHKGISKSEQELFLRIFYDEIYELPESEIYSSGYVIHTLEASLWAFLTTKTFEEAVLKAVNLGDDTDTTGSVTGGMAGLFYGVENIPTEWINQLARKGDVLYLAERFGATFGG